MTMQEMIALSPDQILAQIPEPQRAKLIELRPILEKRGCVVLHHGDDRLSNYRLRYLDTDPETGTKIHRSVPMGRALDGGLLARVLVTRWQAEHRSKAKEEREAKHKALVEAREKARQDRFDRNIIKLIVPGGRRRKERVADEFTAAVNEGPVAAWSFLNKVEAMRAPKPGRPRAGKLW